MTKTFCHFLLQYKFQIQKQIILIINYQSIKGS